MISLVVIVAKAAIARAVDVTVVAAAVVAMDVVARVVGAIRIVAIVVAGVMVEAVVVGVGVVAKPLRLHRSSLGLRVAVQRRRSRHRRPSRGRCMVRFVASFPPAS
jgi:hypothetical protein